MTTPLPGTISEPVRHEVVVTKSRFIADLSPAASVEAADAVIAAVRKEFWDARHHCTALIIGANGDVQRSSDDGEPSGTAGAPMLAVLRGSGLTDVVAVVTRYFGGTLLGAGGLVRAYGGAVREALDGAARLDRILMARYDVVVPIAEAGRADHVLRHWTAGVGGDIADVRYAATEVTFDVLVPAEAAPAASASASAGASVTDALGRAGIPHTAGARGTVVRDVPS